MRTYLSSLLLFFVSVPAFGQNEKPEIITELPDQSTSPSLIPKRSLQVERGASIETDRTSGLATNTLCNNTLIKYGIHKSFELAISASYVASIIRIEERTQKKG